MWTKTGLLEKCFPILFAGCQVSEMATIRQLALISFADEWVGDLA